MTKLYVANTTPQDRQLHYRRLEHLRTMQLDIPRGAQMPFPFDCTAAEIADLIQQQEPFGMFAAANVGQARSHISALYSVGKPVSEAQMRQALERNLQLMGEEGLRLRKAAAVGISNIMANNDPEHYQGARVSVVEKSDDPDVNESHLHRRNGDYADLGSIDAPVQAPSFRKSRRARKGLN